MKPASAVAAISLAIAATACSAPTSTNAVVTGAAGTGAAVDPAGSPTATAVPTTRLTTGTPPAATVLGRFRIAGGPYPGTPRPIDGVISVHVGSTTGKVTATTHTKHGRFSVTLAPGRYSFTGKSGQLTDNGPGCPTYRPVTAHSGETVHVLVQCDVP